MKIYFHCSSAGKEQYLKEYNSLVQLLKKLNHKVFADHILKRDRLIAGKTKKAIYHDIQKQKKLIKSCDAVIIESTYPSVGVGYLTAYALGQHKNVLVLYQKTPHAVLLSETNRLMTLKKYDIENEGSLLHNLKSFLKKTQNKILKYRFNMMIDQPLNELLNSEAGKLHMSKAEYIRRLISEKLILSK